MIEIWLRLRRPDRRVVDGALTLVVIILMEVNNGLASGITTSQRVVTAVAAVPYAAPIAFRRVWPAHALVISALVVLASMFLGGQILSNAGVDLITPLLLSYTAASSTDDRESLISIGITLALLWAWAIIPRPDSSMTSAAQTAQAIFYTTILVVPTWLVGWFARHRQERSGAFRELAARTAAEVSLERDGAIAFERHRIGTELQTLITQSVSEMVDRAVDARRTLTKDDGAARASILAIEGTGREALADLRRLLGILRKDGDPRALSPQPGLGQVDALLESLRDHGLECGCETAGPRIDLSAGLDLVAYRVVEAGLRAAAGRDGGRGSVVLRYRTRELEIEVRGDQPLPDLEGAFSAVAQRMALYDGALRTEESVDGFVLRAWLPLGLAGRP